jgi:hypothetical protein
MNNRDKAILNDLHQFRVLSRDQIISLHFGDVKDSVSSCNKVLKRLQRDDHVICDPTRRPFMYFPKPSTVKKNSGKLPHFLAIADFVIEAKKLGTVRNVQVEVKLGEKGTVEPDLFFMWNNAPFFVEVQQSHRQSIKYMEKKMERYEEYFNGGAWKELPWQHETKKFFPYVLVISDHAYNVKTSVKLFQAKSMSDFVDRYVPKK